jgi:hypothetical protein
LRLSVNNNFYATYFYPEQGAFLAQRQFKRQAKKDSDAFRRLSGENGNGSPTHPTPIVSRGQPPPKAGFAFEKAIFVQLLFASRFSA